MDGVEFIEQLHERQLSIPLIVASSREVVLINTVETMARNLGFPVVAGIRKPLQRESLAAAFEGWDRQQAAPGEPRQRAPQEPSRAHDLAEAIESGAIAVHYQPKVDMAKGTVCGVEALARWTHPSSARSAPTASSRWPSARA